MADAHDPKTIITADAFTVAPQLLGLPLSSPSRRAAAMLLDLVVVGIMIKAIGFTFFALAAALLLFRVAKPSGKGGTLRRGTSIGVRVAGIIMLAAFGASLVDKVRDFVQNPGITIRTDDDEPAADSDSAGYRPDFNITDTRALGLVALLESSDDDSTARVHADSIAAWTRNRSADPAERARFARWVQERSKDFAHAAQLRAALRPLVGDTVRPRDAAAIRAYADAIERGDTGTAERLRADAQTAIAGARIAQLEASLEDSEEKVDQLNEQLEEEQQGGIIGFFSNLANDLGVGFGWMAVYFTAFVVLWNGQTPGKRLLGIRIIRLDAKPLSWWYAFERFGGYAASLSTGLLGFAQILWDRNRQGIHDKIVSTVVIRDGAPRATAAPPAPRSARRPPA